MIRIQEDLFAGRAPAKMLVQVHDELLFEVPRGGEAEVHAMVRERMEGAAELIVPLRVESGVGDNWLQCK
jgi:DNA polymerase I